MPKNQKGFGAIEALLILVIIGIIGFAGWFVYNSQKKTNQSLDNANKTLTDINQKKKTEVKPTPPNDETADWLLYESPGKEYKIRLADGWSFTRYMKDPYIFDLSNELEIKNGVKAKVVEVEGGRDYSTGFSLGFASDKSFSSSSDPTRGEKQKSLTANNGTEIEKYYYLQTTEPEGIGPPKNGKQYTYIVHSSKGVFIATYTFSPDQTDYHANVEKSVKTVVLP